MRQLVLAAALRVRGVRLGACSASGIATVRVRTQFLRPFELGSGSDPAIEPGSAAHRPVGGRRRPTAVAVAVAVAIRQPSAGEGGQAQGHEARLVDVHADGEGGDGGDEEQGHCGDKKDEPHGVGVPTLGEMEPQPWSN